MKKFLPKIELGEMEPGVIFSLIIWPFITQVMIGEDRVSWGGREGKGATALPSAWAGAAGALRGPRSALGSNQFSSRP